MLTAGVILYATLSADPTGDVPMVLFPGADKLIHAVMFGGLAGAIAFDWQRGHRRRRMPARLMCLIGLGVAVFGAVDELAQMLLTRERSGDWLDWLADIAGVIVAVFAAPRAVYSVVHIKKND